LTNWPGDASDVTAGARSLRILVGGALRSQRRGGRSPSAVDAFLAASRGGDFDALLALLDPDVVLRADRAAVNAGAYRGRARCDGRGWHLLWACPVRPTGAHRRCRGTVWVPGGRPRVVFGFTIIHGKITEIHLVADAERLRQLDLAVLNAVLNN
jgi:hypothetical protein